MPSRTARWRQISEEPPVKPEQPFHSPPTSGRLCHCDERPRLSILCPSPGQSVQAGGARPRVPWEKGRARRSLTACTGALVKPCAGSNTALRRTWLFRLFGFFVTQDGAGRVLGGSPDASLRPLPPFRTELRNAVSQLPLNPRSMPASRPRCHQECAARHRPRSYSRRRPSKADCSRSLFRGLGFAWYPARVFPNVYKHILGYTKVVGEILSLARLPVPPLSQSCGRSHCTTIWPPRRIAAHIPHHFHGVAA
jgi:hypothetical protein